MRKLILLSIVLLIVAALGVVRFIDSDYRGASPIAWSFNDIRHRTLSLEDKTKVQIISFGDSGSACSATIGTNESQAGLACEWKISDGKLFIFYSKQLRWELILLAKTKKEFVVRDGAGTVSVSGVTSKPATAGQGPNSKPASATGTFGVIEG